MNIRNFCIIAHIDHGKSTLADRMLEITGTTHSTDNKQMLDTMDLEKERGITIKMTPARMQWKWYELNLIDTPWHADFQYEVSRSLSAVEWVVLLVDASQGIQAQTLSTLYMAMNLGLEIIPVLNKVDLPAADPDRVGDEIENTIGIDKSDIIQISAKTGMNVDLVLDAIIERIPVPNSNSTPELAAKALIFDSVYDKYKWVLNYVKVVEWEINNNTNLYLIHSESNITPPEVWYVDPGYKKDKKLTAWQIWYIVTWLKSVRDAKIWDTMISLAKWDHEHLKLADVRRGNFDTLEQFAIKWFAKAKPYVYAWVYPHDTSEYDKLKESFEKLSINDSAIEYTHENSAALWVGFRVGFLWMLHMDIIKERLSREFDMETIFTTPTVIYIVKTKGYTHPKIKDWSNLLEIVKSWLYTHIITNFTQKLTTEQEAYIQSHTDDQIAEHFKEELKAWVLVRSGADMISKGDSDQIYEPVAEVEIVGPKEYSWAIMSLTQDYRGKLINMDYLDQTRVVWKYYIPMGEIIIDFNDRLKSSTKWYATMNYDFKKYEESDLVKLDIFINEEIVEAFSLIIHKDKAYQVWKDITERLKDLIPKHMFAIPIQAWIGTKMIARETISAMRKDVIAKCYGWDISRKKKLLKKQKEWKKRMKAMWNVNVPSDVFIKMVQRGEW